MKAHLDKRTRSRSFPQGLWPVLLLALLYAGTVCFFALRALPTLPPAHVEGTLRGVVKTRTARSLMLQSANFTQPTGESQALGEVLVYADGAAAVFTGQTVTLRALPQPFVSNGNPGGFDVRVYAATQGWQYQADGVILAVEGEPAPPTLREKLLARLQRVFPTDDGVLAALLLGEKDALPDAARDAYAASGAAHVLAVSGLHVGFVLLLLTTLLLPFGRHSAVTYALLLAGLAGYCTLTGLSPSTLRAALMAAYALTARRLGFKAEPLNALSAACALLLVAKPLQLLTASFQLSACAVLGLACLAPRLAKLPGIKQMPAALRDALCTTVAAQVGCLPLLTRFYGSVSLLSLLTNLAVVPLAGGAVFLGLLALPMSYVPFLAPVTAFFASAAQLCANGMGAVAGLLSGVGGGLLPLPQAPVWLCVLWPVLLALCSKEFSLLKVKPRRFTRIGAAALTVILMAVTVAGWFPAATELTFLSVGCADAALLRRGTLALAVDTGRDGDALTDALHAKGLPVLDALFITHADADHAGGAESVLANNRVKALVYPRGLETDPAFHAVLQRAQALQTALCPVAAGERLCYDGVTVDVLAPLQADPTASNKTCLVLLLTDAATGKRALFLGDLPATAQQEMLLPRADVCTVAHHGSANGVTLRTLETVRPSAAVLSVGSNPYGLPAPETLELLASRAIPVYRTDEQGAVTLRFCDLP